MFEMLTTNGPSAWLPFLAQEWISATGNVVLVVLGFSLVVFVHELGHFLAAKWRQVRVERFSVGFGPELLGFTRGETRYSFCVLPLGGYVKMLGQEDFEIDKSGELAVKNDPRSFTNKPVSSRMIIVTAGVVMNLIFAALLYVVVYMVGREEIKPVIGYILPETPAARAGLTVGDRILSINGSHVSNFEQVLMGIRLSDPFSEITFDIERNGRIVHERIQPEKSEIDGEEVLRVGFNFADTPEIQSAYRGYLKQKTYPLPGDVIKKINGTDVGSTRGQAIMDLILQGADKPSTVEVERKDPSHPDNPPSLVEFTVPKWISFLPREVNGQPSMDLLGLVPRVRVMGIYTGSRAEQAGLIEGDIIVGWGSVRLPTINDIVSSLDRYPEMDIPVRVLRDGAELREPLYYRPMRLDPQRKLRPANRVGFELDAIEQDRVVVADVLPEVSEKSTAAATAGLSKGCRIITVNGESISGWADLAERFKKLSGTEVELSYLPPDRTESPMTTKMNIPRCISGVLGIPPFALSYQSVTFLLDGQTDVLVRSPDGKEDYRPAIQPAAIEYYLKSKIGQEVSFTFRDAGGEVVTRSLLITPDLTDPWYRRVFYQIPLIQTKPATFMNRKTNPLDAIRAGVLQAEYDVRNVYVFLRRVIFTQSVSAKGMSGPIGIMYHGAKAAHRSMIDLVLLMAMISASLAVFNFLPLPLLDGGLIVFLIIEWIKGSPVSLRVQVATQMIGMFLFAGLFLYVTFNDITRIFF